MTPDLVTESDVREGAVFERRDHDKWRRFRVLAIRTTKLGRQVFGATANNKPLTGYTISRLVKACARGDARLVSRAPDMTMRQAPTLKGHRPPNPDMSLRVKLPRGVSRKDFLADVRRRHARGETAEQIAGELGVLVEVVRAVLEEAA